MKKINSKIRIRSINEKKKAINNNEIIVNATTKNHTNSKNKKNQINGNPHQQQQQLELQPVPTITRSRNQPLRQLQITQVVIVAPLLINPNKYYPDLN